MNAQAMNSPDLSPLVYILPVVRELPSLPAPPAPPAPGDRTLLLATHGFHLKAPLSPARPSSFSGPRRRRIMAAPPAASSAMIVTVAERTAATSVIVSAGARRRGALPSPPRSAPGREAPRPRPRSSAARSAALQRDLERAHATAAGARGAVNRTVRRARLPLCSTVAVIVRRRRRRGRSNGAAAAGGAERPHDPGAAFLEAQALPGRPARRPAQRARGAVAEHLRADLWRGQHRAGIDARERRRPGGRVTAQAPPPRGQPRPT